MLPVGLRLSNLFYAVFSMVKGICKTFFGVTRAFSSEISRHKINPPGNREVNMQETSISIQRSEEELKEDRAQQKNRGKSR